MPLPEVSETGKTRLFPEPVSRSGQAKRGQTQNINILLYFVASFFVSRTNVNVLRLTPFVTRQKTSESEDSDHSASRSFC